MDEYRNRYALYKMDPDLQAAHAAFPFIAVCDDHEVDNDWAGTTPSDPESQTEEQFVPRRAIAAQAFCEHLPLSKLSRPRDADMQLYRKVKVGDLATIYLLDTRQYRSDQPCGTSPKKNPPVLDDCDERYHPELTMTGNHQERWLFRGLKRSRARWNIIAQQVWFSPIVYVGSEGQKQYNTDQWDGYPIQRQRILDFLAEERPSKVVVLSGDWHVSGIADVFHDFDDPGSEILATELCGTSISSVGPWTPIMEMKQNRELNPHLKYLDGDHLLPPGPYYDVHGYVICQITPDELRSEYRVVETVKLPDKPIQTAATFLVQDGQPGAIQLT